MMCSRSSARKDKESSQPIRKRGLTRRLQTSDKEARASGQRLYAHINEQREIYDTIGARGNGSGPHSSAQASREQKRNCLA